MKSLLMCLALVFACATGVPVEKKPIMSIARPHLLPVEEEAAPEKPLFTKKDTAVARATVAAFSASLSADQLGTADADQWTALAFDTVTLNRPEGAYSAETGSFTADVSGHYSFSVSCTSALYRHIGIRLNIGGATVVSAFDNYADYSSGSAGLSYIMFMAKDAVAQVQWNAQRQHGIRGGGYCSFSGFYIGFDE